MVEKRRVIIFLCLGIFFVFALRDLVDEARQDFAVFKNLRGMDNDQKRSAMMGELYAFVKKCRQKMPESVSALVISDSANDGLYLAYHLYPRKLFFIDRGEARFIPSETPELDFGFIKNNNINWVISRFSIKASKNTVETLSEYIAGRPNN